MTHRLGYDDEPCARLANLRPESAPEELASKTWAGGQLSVFGGADYSSQELDGLSNDAWIYTL